MQQWGKIMIIYIRVFWCWNHKARQLSLKAVDIHSANYCLYTATALTEPKKFQYSLNSPIDYLKDYLILLRYFNTL